jgi:riboflavin synthase
VFTGLIEAIGIVRSLQPIPGGVRLAMASSLAPSLGAGDSLAVNGVCLTIVETGADTIAADVSPETLRVTSLGNLASGLLVNLERPVRADARLGGHFVLGHVDTIGTLANIAKEGEFWRVTVAYPAQIAPLLIPKGSVTVNGISLTVAALRPGEFDVQIVPQTWVSTNLHVAAVGDCVNLEGDVLGKYVARIAELTRAAARGHDTARDERQSIASDEEVGGASRAAGHDVVSRK